MFGGELVYVSSTGVEGRWSTFRNAGWFFLATSGSGAQWLLSLLGWLAFRRSAGRAPRSALLGWSIFAVNAWMPAMYLIVSPAFAFGDWMDILVRFAALGPMRVSAAVTGLFVSGLLWRASCETLGRLVGGGAGASRTERAARLTRSVWLGSGVVAGLAGLSAPAGAVVGLAIGLGSSLGSTWPIMLAARRVGERPVPGPALDVARSRALLLAAVVSASLFVAVLGPGIRFD